MITKSSTPVKRKRLGRVPAVLISLVLLWIGWSLFMARMALFPQWYVATGVTSELRPCTSYQRRVYLHCGDPSQTLGLSFEAFNAPARQVRGRELQTSGWWIPVETPRAAVILVHGAGADRRAMLKHAKYLNRAGFATALIDAHNHGMNPRDGRGISLGYYESESVLAAVEWVKTKLSPQSIPIAAMGTSQGAVAVLRAASLSPEIRAVVAENPFSSLRKILFSYSGLSWFPRPVKEGGLLLVSLWLGISPTDLDATQFGAQLSGTPVFLIHPLHDKIVPVAQSREIYEALAGGAAAGHELWTPEDDDHEAVWNGNPKAYEAKVLGFLGHTIAPRAEAEEASPKAVRPAEGQVGR